MCVESVKTTTTEWVVKGGFQVKYMDGHHGEIPFTQFQIISKVVWSIGECPSTKTISILMLYPISVDNGNITPIFLNSNLPLQHVSIGSIHVQERFEGSAVSNDLKLCPIKEVIQIFQSPHKAKAFKLSSTIYSL